jgi:hypothetical protein
MARSSINGRIRRNGWSAGTKVSGEMLKKNARCGFASPIIGRHLRSFTLLHLSGGDENKTLIGRLCQTPC